VHKDTGGCEGMYRESFGSRILAAFLVALLATVSLGFTWAVVDDYAARDVRAPVYGLV
jgi:hypothetical protein